MELVLKQKKDSSTNDALVIMLEWEIDNKKQKYIRKVDIGETIEVQDDLGYAILAQYKGCFLIKAQVPENVKVAYETKTMKAKE